MWSVLLLNLTIVHQPGENHGNAGGLSHKRSSPWPQCARPGCHLPTGPSSMEEQPFYKTSIASSMDADLILAVSGEDWMGLMDDYNPKKCIYPSVGYPQLQDGNCQFFLVSWIKDNMFPDWKDVKGLNPEIHLLWHHQNNMSIDPVTHRHGTGSAQTSAFGGHLGRNWTLARLICRFYWPGMHHDFHDWMTECMPCMKRKSRSGRRYPLGE